ncbi:hypothetical protein WH47_04472, partial [Habropoda laboriosa]
VSYFELLSRNETVHSDTYYSPLLRALQYFLLGKKFDNIDSIRNNIKNSLMKNRRDFMTLPKRGEV